MSHMADFARAINLIRKYEGFNESAYANFETGEEPYTIGYGTQFYPDGNPVRKGQKCTKSKALEYLIFELQVIEEQLDVALPNLNPSMKEALLSFIHSIGWDSFLYSEIIDHIDQGEIDEASKVLHKWIFDAHRHAIGTLVQRRRDECKLFLDESADSPHAATDLLLAAFRNYTGAPHQVKAVRRLEVSLSPYVLSEFANDYRVMENPYRYYPLDYQ